MSNPPAPEVKAYLDGVPEKYRQPLVRVVGVLQEKLQLEPTVSYGIIAFMLYGKYGIYVSGWKDHMSFHGGHFLAPLAEKHPEWLKSKGATIWFQDQPELPEEIVDSVISARLASMPEEHIPGNLRSWPPV